VIEFCSRGDNVKIIVDVLGIRHDFACSRPPARVVIRFFESFTVGELFAYWFEHPGADVAPRTQNVFLSVEGYALDPRQDDLPLHIAVARGHPACAPLGARIDVAWKDFEYRLHFHGGDQILQLPYDETVEVLKAGFRFTNRLEKQLSLAGGDPPSPDRLEVKYMDELLRDTLRAIRYECSIHTHRDK
jgi:hypothetical protein